MQDYMDVNREFWDAATALHLGPGEIYDVAAFKRGGLTLHSIEREALGDIAGKSILHAQCHIGVDSMSLARLGARVTGVDFSAPALGVAAALADRAGVAATWVETDVLDARSAVSGDFDVVYTSIGTICWLEDLDRWAAQIAALLRPGGTFFIRDGHPALLALDEDAQELTTRYPYFGDGRAQQWDDDSTYAGDGTVAHSRTYEWPHPLSEILGALLGAGLRLVHFDEGRTLPWRFSPRMVEVPRGYAWPEAERNLIPCTFTIVARKD